MKKAMILFLFFSNIALAQIPTNDPGMALLSAYSCDSVGNKSSEQLSSIKSLENVVSAIQNDDQCRSLANQISSLPNIDNILDNLRQSTIAESIKQEESIINQALADLQEIDEKKMNEDNKYLYPDPEVLRSTIQLAKTRLTSLKAQLSADKLIAERESYVNGISQLNELGNSISGLLQNPSDDCLNKHPGVKASMASSLFGISGFFMNQPLGVATNLAGKLLQNVLTIGRDIKNAKNNRKAFEGIQSINLMSGLSCGLESLASQRCRLNREHDLFQRLVKFRSKSTEDINKELGGLLQNDCLANSILLPNLSEESIGPIINWVRESQNLGIGLVGDQAIQERKQALSSFIAGASNYDTQVSGINGKLRSFTNEATKKLERRKELLSSYSNSISEESGMSGGMGMGYGTNELFSSPLAKQVLTEDEHRKLFIRLVSSSEKSDQEVDEDYRKLRSEYENFVEKNRSDFERGRLIPEESSYTMYSAITRGVDLNKSLNNGSLPEATKDLTLVLMEERTIAQNQINLEILKQKISDALAGNSAKEKKDALILKFFGTNGSSLSPYEHLLKLEKYLDNLPSLPKNRSTFLGIDKFKRSIRDVLEESDTLLDQQANGDSVVDWNQLINKMSELVGANNNISMKVANINKEISNYHASKLNDKVKSLNDDQKQKYNDVLFLMNMDNLKTAIAISNTPADQHYDYINAKELNNAHMKGFHEFFKDYISQALDQSQKSDPYLKQKLCISLLALPDIDDKTKQSCKGVKLKSLTGDAEIDFDNLLSKNPDERACSYQDFKMREYYSINFQ